MHGRSDASTSTDDVKPRPLCLFYFSEPLGVLAAEPPCVVPAPYPHMPPTWPVPAPSAPHSSASAYCSTTSSDPPPVNSLEVPAPLLVLAAPRRTSLSSSLLSTPAWAAGVEPAWALPPRPALLPPLRVPLAPPAPPPDATRTVDAWRDTWRQPERFSLPPIELPRLCELSADEDDATADRCSSGVEWAPVNSRSWTPLVQPASAARSVAPARRRVQWGVRKDRTPRRRGRMSGLRRSLAQLMRRSIRGDSACSSCSAAEGGACSEAECGVRAALRTLRAAWPERPTLHRRRPHRRSRTSHTRVWRIGSRVSSACTWFDVSAPVHLAPAPAAATMPGGASPGLLRRRYSVPETIMRKYCLAQQRSDSDSPCVSPASASPAPCGACGGRGGGGHEREVMRKSALMRRLWGRAPASRSLHGSSAELRRSPAGSGWASPKRQRLEWPSPLSPPCSDCTFASHRARSPASRGDPALPETAPARPDVFTRYSELVNDSAPAVHPLSASSGTPTTSPPTTQEVRTAAAPVFDEPKLEVPPKRPTRIDVEVDRYSSLPYVPPTAETTPTPPYEVLEIVVSETSDASRAPPSPTPSPARTPSKGGRNINIDEYVSNILVESLNSLTEQLEGVTGGTGAERVSVVEKEIKVRLQHAGVNTVVHLSPTSNHQIIFGNAELLHRDRPPPPPPEPPSPPRSPPLEGVNRAVLQQIQKLFHDELHRLDPGVAYPGEPTLAQIEVSNVDAFLDRLGDEEWLHPGAPHSASMEAHASSSEPEPCPSLVDSLDDPASPRVPPSVAAPLGRLARSAVDVLDLPPEAAPEPSPPSPRDRVEAFFIGITDDDGSAGRGGAVAEHMPDTIRERLLRRQRKRESRMESRRGRGRARGRARDAERDAQAVLGALVDELIAKIAHDEHTYLRMKRAHSPPGVRGRLALRRRAPPAPAPPAAPRRLYQKSEIHDGDKCIEILEILEYVDDSQNSSETTNSDERPSGRVRRSRIPVPVYERIRRTRVGRASRRSPPPAPSPTSPPPAPPPARRASVPPPSSPRARAGSLRFRRVFDVIPEERAPDDRRVSAPNLATAVPALAPPPAAPLALAAPAPSPPRATRSAATSPPAPQRASRSTMTSPRRSPPRAPAAGVPSRVAAGIALACTACR